ncbi:uncharacterized protein LOC144101878 [Amblyomma americanum]
MQRRKTDFAIRLSASDPWVPSEYTKICSKHFKPEDYHQGTKRRLLLAHAVPSQFQESTLQARNCRFRRRRCQRPAEEDCGPAVFSAVPGRSTEHGSSSGRQRRSTDGVAGPPVRATTSPVIIRPLKASSSRCNGEGQQSTGSEAGTFIRVTVAPVVKQYMRGNSLGRNGEGQRNAGSEVIPPVRVTTSPVVIRPLRDSSSGYDCERQRNTGSEVGPAVRATKTPVVVIRSPENSITGLDWEGPEPEEAGGQSKASDIGVTPSSVANEVQNCVEAVPAGVMATSSVACQTQVSGLTIAEYEEQIKALKKECKRLRGELCELRILQLSTET